jgi:hypothetical protein
MNTPDDSKLQRFLEGFRQPERMQEFSTAESDPQIIALTQFLQALTTTVGPNDVILDVGSGRGLLAHILMRIWPQHHLRPWYYAVDRGSVLDDLSLPQSIHNKSQKILFAEFVNAQLPCAVETVKLVVLRNVLHELDISTTADVLMALCKIVQPATQVYLQDMVSLPKGEREKAGWPVDLLHDVLETVGFDSGTPARHRSRSGTEWFTFILKKTARCQVTNAVDMARVIAQAREKQRQLRTVTLANLGSDPSEALIPEFIALSMEVAALATQLQQNHYAAAHTLPDSRTVAGIPLIALPAAAGDYAEELPAPTAARTGVRGLLSSKSLIDLPLLIRYAARRLWFAGYSERLLFTVPEVRTALHDAVLKGIDVRILMVDPASPAAFARGLSDAYATPNDLFKDIETTRNEFAAFDEGVRSAAGQNDTLHCELRLCTNALSSSFFIVDDLCICSLYSSNLRGGAGVTFVFGSSSVQPNGYFQVLFREFQSGWTEAERKRHDKLTLQESPGDV